MRRPQGYATWIDPGGVVERDTFTCSHCNAIKHVDPRNEDLHVCKRCMSFICNRCVRKRCVPFMEKVDQLEKALQRHVEVGRWWESH